jgi:hypothetical protein
MRTTTLIAAGLLALGGILWLGCQEEMVGAPCVPETDKGEFDSTLEGTTYSIETRSVQCETRICLTKTVVEESGDKCEDNPNLDNCEGVQSKFSFCSCRCKDMGGNTFNTNPDKYDYLCECPPNTKCEEVLGSIEEAPEKVTGSYCIPDCIATPCEPPEICVPSKNSEKPWNWKCVEPD